MGEDHGDRSPTQHETTQRFVQSWTWGTDRDAQPTQFPLGTCEMDRLTIEGTDPDATSPGIPARGLREEDVAQIVHDLKHPLATIALEAALLDGVVAQNDHRALQRAVTRINRNVEFLDRMVHDLLDLCAIDVGHFMVHRTPTELRGLLASLMDRVVASRDAGRVVLEAPAAITLAIDDHRIERVVANLVQNALAYAPRSSRITIRLDVQDAFACVSVIDNGPGIAPHEREHIFDRYRRASTARTHDGNGLGLYVSKNIVEAHGGTIGVDSVPGAGSRFFFQLPIE